jgi:hypothetical protein
MPIPDDEKKRYIDFALELAQELGSILIPPDTILWHYTNGSSLIAIIESMSIFSTHLSCLNDTTELRYASNLFQQALLTKRASITSVSTTSALLDGALEYFKENPDFPAQAIVPQFVSCFSEERDDLSQWRAYGGGENGYAIGFRAADLWGCRDAVLVRISYDTALHSALARKSVEAMVEFFLDAVKRYGPADLVNFGKEFLQAWDQAITMLAPLVKDPGFAKERECRIVKGFQLDELEKLKFLQKGSLMARHLPLQPPRGSATTPYRLPIAEVMVGPCRHPQISRTSVDTILRQKGYSTGLISISKIPFQST